MTRLTLGILLLAGAGCVHLQPVGPLAGTFGAKEPPATSPAPNVKATAAREAPKPVIQPAPPPPPPALLVTPGEVTEANYQDAAHRLMREMEADREALEAMPRYSEISVIKR